MARGDKFDCICRYTEVTVNISSLPFLKYIYCFDIK